MRQHWNAEYTVRTDVTGFTTEEYDSEDLVEILAPSSGMKKGDEMSETSGDTHLFKHENANTATTPTPTPTHAT